MPTTADITDTRRSAGLAVALLVLAVGTGCDAPHQADPPVEPPGAATQEDAFGFTPPTAATLAANKAAGKDLPVDNEDDAAALRGLLATTDTLTVGGQFGANVWDLSGYRFLTPLEQEAGSIHPALLRQARLNNITGLFEVVPGVYQLRGFDLSNMTLIRGASGWIVVDPLTSRETAAAALAFAFEHLPQRPVSAVLFTHSHADHFAGVLGVIDVDDAAARQVPIVAPAGFLDEALSENVGAGVAMARRASYMYGRALPRSPRGHVDSGLGKSPAFGRFGIIAPTDTISRTGETRRIDGVQFVFQNAPGSEAPAEMTFFLPEHGAWCGAEIVSRTMHNLYTLRGAKVRDALAWSGYIDEARQLFAAADVAFMSHHWPVFGKENVQAFLADQRDLYKYLHDQTLRMINIGMTPGEIADTLQLPVALESRFANHGFYGTVRHNARAIYQSYLGWYDANPASLNPLPPVDAARRYVDYMGGASAVLSRAATAFEAGDYRWVAEVVNHVVFAEPSNADAKALLAAAYDQLGYQSESAPWRDVYLSAAYELRHGIVPFPSMLEHAEDMLAQMPLENFFRTMATRLDPAKANGERHAIAIEFTDLSKTYLLEVANDVLHHRAVDAGASPGVDATLRVTHAMYLTLASGKTGFVKALASDQMSIEGNRLELVGFFGLFDEPDGNFAIVTP